MDPRSLASVFAGWDSHQVSLVNSIAPRSREQLQYRPGPGLRSVGEIGAHIAFARIRWFDRMGTSGAAELARRLAELESEAAFANDPGELARWLEASWAMVEETLNRWTVEDLQQTYRQEYVGKTYSVSRQWPIWRVLAHDLHHGGELAVMLGMLGVPVPELGDLGGHLTEPPLAEP